MSATDTGRHPLRLPGDPPGGPRAGVVWGIGVLVYFIAVVHRSSLGVAGIDAADRFHIGASALSSFSILQVLVYAGMQIPVGLLVDRFGTKRVLSVGVVLLTAGQLGFALCHSYGLALAARAVLGCGDAMTFISVLRLGSRWFPARRGPLIAQGAALFGMAGNLVSTLLLARLLHSAGWARTFTGTALGGALVLVLILLFMKDAPEGHRAPPAQPMAPAAVRRQLAAAWREPGTRLGMWVHFTTQFSGMVFLLLWGMPFLVESEGLSRADAGTLLTVVVASNMVLGMVFGQVISRHHGARTPLTLGVIGATAAVWAVVLPWPGHAPMWLLVVLCVVLGACGPASMIGFDFARPANPPERLGTVSGIVNMGGFTASMVTLLAIGVLLDATGDDYRLSFCTVFVVQLLGLAQILRLRGKAARRERETITVSRVETVHTVEAGAA
ncbi:MULTISPECIES: MFS transporter [Streptomycetaceae]|uniref:Transmembrane transport protein n=1 Tax=Streptantibioticus cattleyicolor (strain ATCC 35852 / DSM 46488 / JCM 4925 / NBRC 14057 / NRRL 8057) TaxID=1003195 RepID=F8JRA2_STREN|nr:MULTISPECIES: MFS transporter [Streptomycetaceae]AEW95406.1 transmembrane transport protein [Streptantibioticus cattleyicolor NRRL 8057 = DSM 46488]MYS59977.1 MFS transporter [Streptomyces sp. SID5468]CCB75749.1 Transmembrane transport protein [Streptantibioticus cattleyicolor NRRL 8057 = DSM 46488]